MNRDDIIRMAREVGLPHWYEDNTLVNESLVLKFAALVAAAEREECARLASEPQCWPLPNFTNAPSERTMGRIEGEKEMSRQIASAIRARGEQK